MNLSAAYWNTTPLKQLNAEEWESLCDGCGKCCLHKLRDDETDEIFYTRVACRLLEQVRRCSLRSDFPKYRTAWM